MTNTIATPQLRGLAAEWKKLFKSATPSGIVGDAAHAARGGYHIGRQYQSRTNYSVTRPHDGPGCGPNNTASALDMTMSSADMIECTKRLKAAYDNVDDPRRKYINAFNGWPGYGEALRYDVYARKTSSASADHKWHVHLELRRLYSDSDTAVKAVLSILKGETVDTYLRSIGVTPAAAVKVTESATKMPVAPPYPGHVLTRGASNDPGLKKWQQRMIDRGWKSLGKADGDFGPKTESVVRRFQAVCKLQVDGKIGPATWPKPWTQRLGG